MAYWDRDPLFGQFASELRHKITETPMPPQSPASGDFEADGPDHRALFEMLRASRSGLLSHVPFEERVEEAARRAAAERQHELTIAAVGEELRLQQLLASVQHAAAVLQRERGITPAYLQARAQIPGIHAITPAQLEAAGTHAWEKEVGGDAAWERANEESDDYSRGQRALYQHRNQRPPVPLFNAPPRGAGAR